MLYDSATRRSRASTLRVIASRSARKSEIIRLLSGGHSEAAIAQHVGIAPCTVHAHVRDMYDDLGIGDRLMLGIVIADAFPSAASDSAA